MCKTVIVKEYNLNHKIKEPEFGVNMNVNKVKREGKRKLLHNIECEKSCFK